MTNSDPPRVAVALLRRFVNGNEPLVGDLLEGFAARQSRIWFWRQVILAIAIGWFQPRDVKRPLEVAAQSSVVALGGDLNVLGLVILALGVLVPLSRPVMWWMVLPGILGGVAFGLTLAVVRRRAALSAPAAGSRTFPRDVEVSAIPPGRE